jgi:putative spermidine/putrescine transport system permease protein
MTQEMVARGLGMNRLRSFFAVTLPQIKSSVVAGAVCIHLGCRRDHHRTLRCPYQTLTRRMFTALRDEIDPAIAAIKTLLTVA